MNPNNSSYSRHFTRRLSMESVLIDGADINELVKAQPFVEAWDGYDLDRTLVLHDKMDDVLELGKPIMPMIEHMKKTIKGGRKVKIFTARVSFADERINNAVRKVIQDYFFKLVGVMLEVTNIKDQGMRNLYDDRAYHVVPNEGVIVGQENKEDGVVNA